MSYQLHHLLKTGFDDMESNQESPSKLRCAAGYVHRRFAERLDYRPIEQIESTSYSISGRPWRAYGAPKPAFPGCVRAKPASFDRSCAPVGTRNRQSETCRPA